MSRPTPRSRAQEVVGAPGARSLAGSLRLRVERLGGLPLMAIRVWLLGGARHEPVPGLSLATGRMLSEGTRRRDWQTLATDVEDRGMLLQTSGSRETLGVALDALAEDWRLALQWLAEILLEPSLPEDRLRWIRRQAAAELEGLLDQPDYRTARAFVEDLYHPHPYGRPLQGSRESLETLTTEACSAYHRQCLDWGGVVVVTGDIDEAEALAELESLFGTGLGIELAQPDAGDSSQGMHLSGDESGPHAWPSIPGPPSAEAGRREIVAGGVDQAHVYLGHLTVARNHPDRLALDVAAIAMGAGAGTAGRLPTRVREKEGLAYSVDIHLAGAAGLDAGRLTAYAGTSPKRVEQAERAMREELERLVEHGLLEEEVAEAKSYLLGREPFRRETLRQRADLLAEADFYDLPTDQPSWLRSALAELDRQEINAAVRRHIHPDKLKVTVGWPS